MAASGKRMINIINLCPYDVHVQKSGTYLKHTFKMSERIGDIPIISSIAIKSSEEYATSEIDCVDFISESKSMINIHLPEPQEDVFYIVTKDVQVLCSKRKDLLIPDTYRYHHIYKSNGLIEGIVCQGLYHVKEMILI